MKNINRQRCGYLWVTEQEKQLIDDLIKSSGILKNAPVLRTRADFLRISAIALGKIFQKYPFNFSRKIVVEEELIDLIVKHLSCPKP